MNDDFRPLEEEPLSPWLIVPLLLMVGGFVVAVVMAALAMLKIMGVL